MNDKQFANNELQAGGGVKKIAPLWINFCSL